MNKRVISALNGPSPGVTGFLNWITIESISTELLWLIPINQSHKTVHKPTLVCRLSINHVYNKWKESSKFKTKEIRLIPAQANKEMPLIKLLLVIPYLTLSWAHLADASLQSH